MEKNDKSENKRIFEQWFNRNFQHMGQIDMARALKINDEGRYSDAETSQMFSAFAYGKMLSDRSEKSAEISAALFDGMEQNMIRLRKIEAAARNLAKVKGRHHRELAMNQLLESLK
jgi:hypothetical protein